MTSEVKRTYLEKARARADADPELTYALGLIVMTGIEELEFQQRVAGSDLNVAYATHFPLGGRVCELTIKWGSEQ